MEIKDIEEILIMCDDANQSLDQHERTGNAKDVFNKIRAVGDICIENKDIHPDLKKKIPIRSQYDFKSSIFYLSQLDLLTGGIGQNQQVRINLANVKSNIQSVIESYKEDKKHPQQSISEKEREQKFGILLSPRQAEPDFASYSSGLGTDVSVGVLFIDIDNFKSLNTRFTESAVDREVLIPFQRLLSSICLYRGDAYRQGGEEFLVLLPNHTPEEVRQFTERLRRKIEIEEFNVTGSLVCITASIGISLWPQHGNTLPDLIEKANRAEHEAKKNGRNRVEVYMEKNT